jgi:hypothetical protein
MGKLEQTIKLVQVLVKNKALLYKCLAKGINEEGECCRIRKCYHNQHALEVTVLGYKLLYWLVLSIIVLPKFGNLWI